MNNLKHARKMVLVPYNDVAASSEVMRTTPSTAAVGASDISEYYKPKSRDGMLQDLNVHMENILENRALSDQKKIFLHNQMMRKYQFIKDKLENERHDAVDKLVKVLGNSHTKPTVPLSAKTLYSTGRCWSEDHKDFRANLKDIKPGLMDEGGVEEEEDDAIRGVEMNENIDDLLNYTTPKKSDVVVETSRRLRTRRNAVDVKEGVKTLKFENEKSTSGKGNKQKDKQVKGKQKGTGIRSWLHLK